MEKSQSTFKTAGCALICLQAVRAIFVAAAALCCIPAMAESDTLSPPGDPRQSITYWKTHAIDADSDPLVQKSHEVFSVLLRGWDNSRLEPGLYVVDSTTGPWAASLADGNVLLSREAIDTCMAFGEARGEHLLAFVLAHELAHQRADDLWHQRFFRMVGNNSPQTRKIMLQGLALDTLLLSDLEQKEAQADHDGLILMSSVGYDPYQIFDDGSQQGDNFFTSWVESIWQYNCDQSGHGVRPDACQQAQSRALRTRAQLQNVATQSMLYELGVQAFVAGDYEQARAYFTAYGRDYPSRAVLSALGLTYLAQAQALHTRLIELGEIDQPVFYYPLMLDASAEATAVAAGAEDVQKRADRDALIRQMREHMRSAIEQGVALLDKALRLEPEHRKTYLLLATGHLLSGNTYMARGVLQGRYIPKFGRDTSADLLLALTSAIEGNSKQASEAFDALLDSASRPVDGDTAMPQNLLVYSAYYNRAAFATYRGDPQAARAGWERLAKLTRASGNTLLFRLSVNNLVQTGRERNALKSAPTIQGKRLGDRLDEQPDSVVASSPTELWIDGELYRVYRNRDGSRYITSSDDVIISAWQESGDVSISDRIRRGDRADRPFKSLGMPDRRLDMQSGEYLAYDQYGLALHIINDKVSGWFLYQSR